MTNAKRDELWEKYKEENPPKGNARLYYTDNENYWKDGYDIALESHLQSAGEAFDEKAAHEKLTEVFSTWHISEDIYPAVLITAMDLLRWQWEQDKVKIALLKKENEFLKTNPHGYWRSHWEERSAKVEELAEYIDKCMSKLAECEEIERAKEAALAKYTAFEFELRITAGEPDPMTRLKEYDYLVRAGTYLNHGIKPPFNRQKRCGGIRRKE